jgi:hypothetical protein
VELQVGDLKDDSKQKANYFHPEAYCQKHFSNHFFVLFTFVLQYRVKRRPQDAILGVWKEWYLPLIQMTQDIKTSRED